MGESGGCVLVLGSGPGVVDCRSWPRAPFDAIVAINNAHRVRPDWDVAIFPEDFPKDRRPTPAAHQRLISAEAYVPVQNRFGGFVYAGGTMAFTAGYWALAALRPRVLAYLGCDMVYPKAGPTHFYGDGAADPLRQDVTLRSLEAKSARLALFAARAGCHCVTLSGGPSRLVFPQADRADLASLAATHPATVGPAMARPLAEERRLGYRAPNGRYWEVEAAFDAARIDALDALWLTAYQTACAPAPDIARAAQR